MFQEPESRATNVNSILYTCCARGEVEVDDSRRPVKLIVHLSDEYDHEGVRADLAEQFGCGYGCKSDHGVTLDGNKVIIERDKVHDPSIFDFVIAVLAT